MKIASFDSKWWYRLPGRMPQASATSWSDARSPDVAKTDAAVARMSAFRAPSSGTGATPSLVMGPDVGTVASGERSVVEERPTTRGCAREQPTESEPREVCRRDGDVGPFELARVRLAYAVRELLVVVDEQVEVVVHQLERTVDDVAEQERALLPVG